MSEKKMRQLLVKHTKDLHGRCIENRVAVGMPDYCYIYGWIELKHLKAWPKRASTLVRLPHFTPKQRQWLIDHWNLGGKSWVLLQVDKEWLLFPGCYARHIGHVHRQHLYDLAFDRYTPMSSQWHSLKHDLQLGRDNIDRALDELLPSTLNAIAAAHKNMLTKRSKKR